MTTDAASESAPTNITFEGPKRIDPSAWVPPDSHMAVGPSNVVVTVNNLIAWYDKSGNLQNLQSQDSFFGNSDTEHNLFDARIVYDPFGGHFYAISVYRNQDEDDPFTGQSDVFFAESNTSDPTQGWHATSFNTLETDNLGEYWVDYPTLSVDAYGVYVTANYVLFQPDFPPNESSEPDDEDPPPSGVAGGSTTRLFILDKEGNSRQTYDPEHLTGTPNISTPQAAIVYGNQATYGLTGTFLVAYQQNDNANSFLYVIKTSGAATGAASFSMTPINVGNISNTVPTSGNFAKQPNNVGLDAGNAWIYSAVWRAGILYATTEIVPKDTPNRAVVHWFRVDTNSMTLKDQGDVTADDLGPEISTTYGSITVNGSGQFAIGFSASSKNLYAGAYYAVYGADGKLQTTIQTLRSGQDAFVIADSPGANRWGDYSGSAVDPSNDNSFWFFDEYALAPAKGQIVVRGEGNFLDPSNGKPASDSVWSDNNNLLWKWHYNSTLQVVNTTALMNPSGTAPMDASGWTVVASAPWRSDAGIDQMLMKYAPDGTMTLWWTARDGKNEKLTGINLGQRWTNVDYIKGGQFTANGGTNFLVNNTADQHLYDWWIDNDTLQGIDLGAYWSFGRRCSG